MLASQGNFSKRERLNVYILRNIYKNCTDSQVTKLIEAGQSHKFNFSGIFTSFKSRRFTKWEIIIVHIRSTKKIRPKNNKNNFDIVDTCIHYPGF